MMIDSRREPTFNPTPRASRPPPRRRSAAPAAMSLAAVVLLAAAGWFWWSRTQAPEPSAATGEPVAQQQASPAATQPPELLPAPADQVLKADGVNAALMQLLGREAVLKFLETTDFPRKAVATLDNLGREHAPVSAWPVQPSPGRFIAGGTDASQVIAAENALRYLPFVSFVDGIDPVQAVDLYRRMYPVLQEQYRELGLGSRPLHARVMEVIDLLLATPEPRQAPVVTLTQVRGPHESTQPWTRYEYADPALQRLTSGQKILLRVGPDNRKVLKAKLAALRQQLLQVSVAPSPP